MIELEDADKVKLGAFDKDLLRKIINHSIDNLSREIIEEGFTRDYIRGYKHGLFHLMSYFKFYNKK